MNNTYTVNTEQEINGLIPGQKLETKEDVLNYFSAMYAAILKDPPNDKPLIGDDTLSADEAFAIIEAVPGNDGEADSNRLDKLMEGLKVKASQSETSQNARMIGIALGQSLPVTFDAAIEEGFKAADVAEQLIVTLAKAIDPILPRGHNGRINLPIPGTDEITKIKDNNGQEKEYRLEMFDKWKLRQNGLPMSGSVYADAFVQRPEGKAIQETLRQFDTPETAEKSVTHPTGETTTIAQLKGMSGRSRDSARLRWVKRNNNGVKALREAVAFLMQIQDLPSKVLFELSSEPSQGAPGIKLAGRQIVPVGYALINTPKPVQLGDAATPMASSIKPMSIRAFMRLKISHGVNDPHNIDPKSVGEDATVAKLMDTIETDGGTEKKGAEQTVAAITVIDDGDVDAVEEHVATIATWLSNVQNQLLLKTLGQKGKLSEDFLLSIDDVVETLDAVKGYNQKRIDLARAKINAEAERDAAEQRKKLEATG